MSALTLLQAGSSYVTLRHMLFIGLRSLRHMVAGRWGLGVGTEGLFGVLPSRTVLRFHNRCSFRWPRRAGVMSELFDAKGPTSQT